jgi:hypothetical protein
MYPSAADTAVREKLRAVVEELLRKEWPGKPMRVPLAMGEPDCLAPQRPK